MKFKTKFFNSFRYLVRITALDRILRHFTNGIKPDSLVAKLVPNNYQYKTGTVRKINSSGIDVSVDLHDYIGHYIYYGFEDPSQQSLFNLCKPGDTVIDIGTNLGFTVLNMAKLVGDKGFIFGFEPDPRNYAKLQNNISRNKFSNLKTFAKGLGDSPGKFSLETRVEHNSGGNRIVSDNLSTSNTTVEVEIDTLDNCIASLSIQKIDLIKIDVEGYELNVLRGASQALQKFSPVLFIEIDDNNLRDQSASAKDLIAFLEINGYSVVHAETKRKIKAADDFKNCHFDIICNKE